MKRAILFTILCAFLSQTNAQIINIEDKRQEFNDSIGWYERLDLGVQWVENNKSVFSLNGTMQLEFLYKSRMLLSITNYGLISAGGENFVNQGYQHLRYNSIIWDWLTYEAFAQIQYNEKLFIKMRSLAGTGFKFNLFQKNNNSSNLGLAYMFEYDEEAMTEKVHRDHRLSSYLTLAWSITPLLKLVSTSYYQPVLTNWSDFRISSSSSLVFLVAKKFNFKTSFNLLYDSDAPDEAPEYSHSLTSSFVYNF